MGTTVGATALCRLNPRSNGNRVWLLRLTLQWLLPVVFFLASACFADAQSGYSVEIDLEQQTAYLIRGRRIVLASEISSGRSGHLTETGAFKIIEKERNHFSSLYGKIVDRNGRTIVADADADMAVPPGGGIPPPPLRSFLRFPPSTRKHARHLPC